MNPRSLLSIVVPVFNETETIGEFHRRTTAMADGLDGMSYEIIYVDDGSSDGSFNKLSALATSDPRVRVVRFSRNFGHQTAITAGVDHARGDAIAIIDSDLQDPPEVIPTMLQRWSEGYDVVYGVRSRRDGESVMKLATASLFYRTIRRLTSIDIPVDVGDFRLMSRRAADHLRQLRESDRYVRGLVSWIGFNQVGVEYDRDPRLAGETKYPYRKMIKFAFDGITSFSTLPLRLATWTGYAASGFAFLYLLSVFVQKWMGYTVQGWATIMVAILFLGGVQLICLGIAGEYIGRIFNQVKARPIYIVQETLNAQPAAGQRLRLFSGEVETERQLVEPVSAR